MFCEFMYNCLLDIETFWCTAQCMEEHQTNKTQALGSISCKVFSFLVLYLHGFVCSNWCSFFENICWPIDKWILPIKYISLEIHSVFARCSSCCLSAQMQLYNWNAVINSINSHTHLIGWFVFLLCDVNVKLVQFRLVCRGFMVETLRRYRINGLNSARIQAGS